MTLSWWDQAVLRTLAYVDQFQYPLASQEITDRLVSKGAPSPSLSARAAHTQVTQSLRRLVTAGLITQEKNWYALAKAEQLFQLRRHRAHLSQAKWQEVAELVRLVRWVPWIEAIAVTGSLAMDNVIENDDCDFLIVTQPNRVWLTRLAVIAVAIVKGKRRSWSGEERNSWCFNLWLDREHLAMPAAVQSVYGAYEVTQARWVEDRTQIETTFLAQNAWVAQYLPYSPVLKNSKKKRPQPTVVPSLIQRALTGWGDGWDWLAFTVQFWYMRAHMTRERVARGYAFFHPRDTKKGVTTRWQQRLNQVLKEPR